MHPKLAMMDYFYKKLFSDNSYKWNVEGTQKDITELSHQEMIDFYEENYHPSNAQAFCYGSQEYINICLLELDTYLSEFDPNPSVRLASEVKWQEYTSYLSRRDKIPYASYTDTDQVDYRLAIAWVINDEPMDGVQEVAWFLIQDLLIGSRTAAISKVISDLDLGDDIIGGLENKLQQWMFTLGVSGITDSANSDKATKAINDEILHIVENGFNEDAMKASINKVELKVSSILCVYRR
jgi:Zn-dependent M16 (insulinase) family peptidase